MRLVLGTALSFAGPVFFGWLLVRWVWPRSPAGIRLSIGGALGLGLTGAVYFLSLILTRSSRISFAASESLVVGVVAWSLWKWFAHRSLHPALRADLSRGERNRGAAPVIPLSLGEVGAQRRVRAAVLRPSQLLLMRSAFAGVALLASVIALLAVMSSPHGEWDATAVWNLKARFIYHSPADPLSKIMDPALWDTQPDYPLLLPALVARGWQYAGQNSIVIPVCIAIAFTVLTVLTLVNGLKQIAGSLQAYLAGCVLLGTPYFLRHGMSQYADILMACWVLTAVILFSIHDSQDLTPPRLPLLAGVAAGLAACTKNEGLLFVFVLAGVRILVSLRRKSWRTSRLELGGFAAGAAFGVLALGLFKWLYSPPNPIVSGITSATILQRIASTDYHTKILKALTLKAQAFGDWWTAPLLLLVIHAAVALYSRRPGQKYPSIASAALSFLGMAVGYYAVYLLSPYDLDWHIGASMDRLLFQLWPTALLLYSLLAADKLPREVVEHG